MAYGGVVIYHEASKEDPENLPAGWYIDDKDYTTFSIANDPEAVKYLKAPLKNGGYSFEERKAFWNSFFDFKAPKLRLPVKIAKRSGCKLWGMIMARFFIYSTEEAVAALKEAHIPYRVHGECCISVNNNDYSAAVEAFFRNDVSFQPE